MMLDVQNTIWHGMPLGWALHAGGKRKDEMAECLRAAGAVE
jgi:hypothetical protein